jgi:hypothetical protein
MESEFARGSAILYIADQSRPIQQATDTAETRRRDSVNEPPFWTWFIENPTPARCADAKVRGSSPGDIRCRLPS